MDKESEQDTTKWTKPQTVNMCIPPKEKRQYNKMAREVTFKDIKVPVEIIENGAKYAVKVAIIRKTSKEYGALVQGWSFEGFGVTRSASLHAAKI